MSIGDAGGVTVLILFVLFPVGIGLNIWGQFKAADKHKKANITLAITFFLGIAFLVIVLYLLGLLEQPITSLHRILNSPISLFQLVIWTFIFSAYGPVSKLITSKLVETANIISTSSNKVTKRVKPRKSTKVIHDPLQAGLNKWQIIEGSPQISHIRGLPQAPSLLLEESPLSKRNSFLVFKGFKRKNFTVSCDIYLERDAVFNLAFRIDKGNSNFYMARIDTRAGGTNGFLVANNKNSWAYILQSNSRVNNDMWHHFELEVKNKKMVMKIDGILVAEVEHLQLPSSGYIGMFNEVKRVFVNNFEIK